jgi:two-component system chemotaxis response regulator CheV
MGSHDNALLTLVDQKTRLAGSNKMELLLFTLGGPEVFGINVFKVREVCETPPVTRAPNMPHGVAGIISLRGAIIPVIDLAAFVGSAFDRPDSKLIITEFSSHLQAFHVAAVDRIVRVDWEHVKTPQPMLAGRAHRLTAITELADGKLVSILDVEQILHDTFADEETIAVERIPAEHARPVFFVDDSALARKKIAQVLESLGVPHMECTNGREAWAKLRELAGQHDGAELRRRLGAILVDAEMPEMDGYVLTQHVKQDARFAGIPVVMHSSLSSVANRKMGQQAGVDAYVAKFHADDLAATLHRLLGESQGVPR